MDRLVIKLSLTLGGGLPNAKLMPPDEIDFEKKRMSIDFNEDSDSDFSYDSEASDGTYVPSSDDDAFVTASSRATSTIASPEPLLHEAVKDIKQEIKIERSLSRSSRSRSNTPVVQTPYNLRSRAGLNRSITSSAVKSETPEAFGRRVKQMERIARLNAQQIIQTVNKNHTPSYFSSDDE